MANTDFTVADVLEWARTKPADERYIYGSVTGCAMCQFLQYAGIPFYLVGGSEWYPAPGKIRPLANELRVALREPGYTFGALVKRLEALCPETPVTKSDWLRIDAYLTEQVEA